MANSHHRPRTVKTILSDQQIETIVRRYPEGVSTTILARQLGLTVSIVRRTLLVNGIPLRSRSLATKLYWSKFRGRTEPLTGQERTARHVHRCFAKGVCHHCGKPYPSAASHGSHCYECRLTAKRRRDERRAKGICTVCGQPVQDKKYSRCPTCQKKARDIARRLKDQVFAAYGGYECACCGETEPVFLSVDHINDDGAKMRKIHGTGMSFYGWLRKHGYPPGYQILCHNCNYAKRFGICPHKKKSKSGR